jgi:hypothetical protein
MLAWWHWKHFFANIAFPGASAAGAGAGGVTCAALVETTKRHVQIHRSTAGRMNGTLKSDLLIFAVT